uniref:Uncharacterized protein LOC105042550 isoform X3 n=1 Tax=Elaeis guineensis var. tenera TaxID=51953 RepID=A0A6I9R1P1_ELAGV|nr:uncharacterized protein LOC105042550 isoform X3 [Elaeis guineensis]
MRSRRRFPSSGARGYTSLSCVVSPAPAAPSMPRASAAATAPSSIAPPPPSSACSTRTSLLFFSLFFSLPHLLSLSNTPKPGLFFWLCLSSEDEIDFKKISEEVGGGGDGGDVRCPETATGGAPSSPPSHCCQPYPSSSSSSHCGRPCSVAALSRPSSDDGEANPRLLYRMHFISQGLPPIKIEPHPLIIQTTARWFRRLNFAQQVG